MPVLNTRNYTEQELVAFCQQTIPLCADRQWIKKFNQQVRDRLCELANLEDTNVSSFAATDITATSVTLVVTEAGVDHPIYLSTTEGISLSGAGTQASPLNLEVNVCAAMPDLPTAITQLCF